MSRFVEALGTRLGAFLGILFLGTVLLTSSLLLRQSVEEIRKLGTFAHFNQVKLAFVTINDLMRLQALLSHVLDDGTLEKSERQRINENIDMLYVRAQDISAKGGHIKSVAMTENLVSELYALIEDADGLMRDTTLSEEDLVSQFRNRIERTRQQIFLQPHKLTELQNSLSAHQSEALEKLLFFSSLAFVALTTVAALALIFLRREIRSRMKRKKAEERAHYLAYYDSLTGLPNRVRFQEIVEREIAKKGAFSVGFADMDHFKVINDTLGHAMGDAVLKRIGRALANQLRIHGGVAARLSGDEFAFLLPIEGKAKLEQICDDIVKACSKPIWHAGDCATPSISVGVAPSRSMSSGKISFDELLRLADFAQYMSKQLGRCKATVYDHKLEEEYKRRQYIMETLPDALADEQLEVFLQPKVRLSDRSVYGFEALVRWRSENGLIAPDLFIEIAEETGLVCDIDALVLRLATRQVADWNLRHGTQFEVSVNLSALNFHSSIVVEQVKSALKNSGLPANLLTLEITESHELCNWVEVGEIIAALNGLGCHMSVDDFGTGYSSLAYLRAIPADELKIDRSLVDEIDRSVQARFMLDAIIDLARGLNMTVVVEGVEREEQAALAAEMRCQKAQGYLFGKPVPALEALADATEKRRNLAS